MRLLLCFYLLIFSFLTLNAQSKIDRPFEVSWKKETSYFATGGGMLLASNILRQRTANFLEIELQALDAANINQFDRKATTYYSPKIDKASDYVWYSTHALPLLFFTQKDLHQDAGTVAVMYSEVLFLNAGATLLSKYTFRRARPFAYNDNAPLEERLGNKAKTSLVSGHTSMSAANTFFVAQVFSTYYPESKWKPAVWSAAIVVPAVTGYLRVRAGRHFPTDVLAGYALGATIGVLVPKLHEQKKWQARGISMTVGMNSAYLEWRF